MSTASKQSDQGKTQTPGSLILLAKPVITVNSGRSRRMPGQTPSTGTEGERAFTVESVCGGYHIAGVEAAGG